MLERLLSILNSRHHSLRFIVTCSCMGMFVCLPALRNPATPFGSHTNASSLIPSPTFQLLSLSQIQNLDVSRDLGAAESAQGDTKELPAHGWE